MMHIYIDTRRVRIKEIVFDIVLKNTYVFSRFKSGGLLIGIKKYC